MAIAIEKKLKVVPILPKIVVFFKKSRIQRIITARNKALKHYNLF